MLPHNVMDLRALEERRRDLLREAASDRRVRKIREEVRSTVVPRNSIPAVQTIAGKTNSQPGWARICCGMGKVLESAGRSLQMLGTKAEMNGTGNRVGFSDRN